MKILKHHIQGVATLIVGVVFLLSALLKMLSLDNFELYLFSFGYLSFDLVSIAARLLLSLEMLLGLALLLRYRFSRLRIVVAGVLVLFTLWLVWQWLAGGEENCHCFGSIISLDAPKSIVKNILLLLLLAVAWRVESWELRFLRRWMVWTVVAIAMLLPFLLFPTDSLMRRLNSSRELDTEFFGDVTDSLFVQQGHRVVMLYSTECRFCRMSAKKLSSMIRRHNLPTESFYAIFMDMGERSDSLIEAFFGANGSIHLPYTTLNARTLLKSTNGVLPLILLMDGDSVVQECNYRCIDESEVREFLLNR